MEKATLLDLLMTVESIQAAKTARIIDIDVRLATLSDVANLVTSAAAAHSTLSCSLVGMHTLTNAHRSLAVLSRLNNVDIKLLDSAPATFFLQAMGHEVPKRIRGQDLMNEVCRQCAEMGLSVYFFGSDSSSLSTLAQKLTQKYPRLKIAGYRPGRYRQLAAGELEEDINAIRDSNADVVFVGLGSPRQDIWIYEMSTVLERPLVAVGAAFDFESGKVKPAPKFMQNLGLEWLYRLLSDPRRLWKRYLIDGPYFLWLVGLQATGALPSKNCDPPQDRLNYG